MHADSKSVKKTDKLTAFFALLGSEGIKAWSKTLMKLTPGCPELNSLFLQIKPLKVFED